MSVLLGCSGQADPGETPEVLSTVRQSVSASTPHVLIVVRTGLAAGLASELSVYQEDLRNEGWEPLLWETNYDDPDTIKQSIQAFRAYVNLVGVFLVGDIPHVLVTAPASREEPPGWSDYFYMDLDGVWQFDVDANGDRVYSRHSAGSGDRGPEVFVGRLHGSNVTLLGRTELQMFREYFQRNHAYRSGAWQATPTSLWVGASSELVAMPGTASPVGNDVLVQQTNLLGDTIEQAYEANAGGTVINPGQSRRWSFSQYGLYGTNASGTFLGTVGNTQDMVRSELGRGHTYAYLSSHGWQEGWENLASSQDVVAIAAQAGHLPVFTFGASCNVGDLGYPDSMGATMTMAGGLGFVGPTTAIAPTASTEIAFLDTLQSRTIGEAVAELHAASIASNTQDNFDSTAVVRLLFGDPTLRLRYAPSQAFVESQGTVAMEAEHFNAKTAMPDHRWNVRYRDAASHDLLMSAEPNTGSVMESNNVANSPRLDFRVKFSTKGTYYVWVRGTRETDNDDSCHVGLDDVAPTTADKIAGFVKGTSISWSKKRTDNTVAKLIVSQTGVHTIHLWMREDGFNVDKMVLTTKSTYTPSAEGPSESQRQTP
jgi:hypothetical protein